MCIICDTPMIDQSTIFLDCSNCPNITTLPEHLPNLKFLMIYDTNITMVPSYESLEGLYCMRCSIETLPDLPKLRKLNATGSSLKTLSGTLYRLETLLIDNTNVSDIPETLISTITVSANNTNVSNISDKLINIESLSVVNTPMTSLKALMSLQYLNCSGTQINSLPINQLPNLRKVYARGCNFSDPFAIIAKGIDLTA